MITPERVQTFVALLAVAAAGLTLALAVPAVRRAIAPLALGFAAAVATTATAGSLYFSEVAHYTPCRLCWFQRIGMYPLALVLSVAAWRRDAGVRWYALPLALLALPVSAYHYLIERVPSLDQGGCDPTTPCTLVWFEELGFVTLPLMAAVAFVTVAALVVIAQPGEHRV